MTIKTFYPPFLVSYMISPSLSDKAILEELGKRLQRHRLNQNVSQEELAREAGIGVNTVYRIERGQSAQLSSLIRILRVLDLLSNIDLLIPEPPTSPIAQAELGKDVRQRASRQSGSDKDQKPWSWDQ